MPAPKGNTNAMTHGVRRSRELARAGLRDAGLRTRRMPKGCQYLASEINAYMGMLYVRVEAGKGRVDANDLEAIDAAAAWHRHALYTSRVLCVDHDALKPEQRVQFSGEIAKAIQRRREQSKQLGVVDPATADPWAVVVNGQAVSRDANGTGEHHAETPDHAPAGDSEDHDG